MVRDFSVKSTSFQLVNLFHHETSKSSFPFFGIQIILVGDFWQLKPIQSGLDNGDPVYESKLFGEVFLHRFDLTIKHCGKMNWKYV